MPSLLFAVAVMLWPTTGILAAPPESTTPAERMAGHRLEQLARRSLGAAADPHPAQVREARLLLRQALQFDPAPANRWLLLAEAEQMAGRRDGLTNALRGYLKRRPDDDVAQLQLIELYGRKQQTAEQLAAFYRRIADGAKSKRFTSALRSRIAFKAATVELEQGDPEAYAEMLSLALKLDPTNKAAAIESFRVLASSPQSAVADQASALLTLFQADPADPQAHITIAESLMSFGLYERAVGWYRSADRILVAEGVSPSQTTLVDWALCLWGSGRLAPALQLLRAAEAGPAPPAGDQGQNQDRNNTAPPAEDDAQPQVDPFANATIDSLMPHALMLAWSGQSEPLNRVFTALTNQFDQLRDDAPNTTRLILGDLWARLLVNRGLDEVPRLIERLEQAEPETDALRQTLTGWLKLREGDLAAAEKMLSDQADEDAQAALGLCMVLEQQLDTAKEAGGNAEQAQALRRRLIRRLRGVRQRMPAELFGVLAAAKLQRLGLSLETDEAGRTVAETLAEVPADLREMVENPREFVRLTAVAEPARFEHGAGTELAITLRNVSRFPLSLGPDGSIPTRLMMMPNIRVGADRGPDLGPNVVDLHRRLRLKPGEAVTVRIRADSGELGRFLARHPVPAVRIDLALLLNPRMGRRGGFVPGAMGSIAHVRHLLRKPAEGVSLEALAGRLDGGDQAAALRAMSVVARAANAGNGEGDGDGPAGDGNDQADTDRPRPADQPQRIVEALAEAAGEASPAGQVWLLTCLPPGPRVADRFDPLIRRLAQVDHPAVQMTLLATQARSADSPWLNAALRRPGDDPAHRFAEARRTALQAQTGD